MTGETCYLVTITKHGCGNMIASEHLLKHS
jgi:hypothetical protein